MSSSLGSVTCGAPFSQSTSSQSINGVTSKRTALEFPVSGTMGSGTVQVDATEDADKNRNMKINVMHLALLTLKLFLGSSVIWSFNSCRR